MEVVHTDDFLKDATRLPKNAQRLLREQEMRFSRNWLDPRLHVKRLKDLKGAFSFRITRNYRALFYLRGSTAVLFAVGNRKDIYR